MKNEEIFIKKIVKKVSTLPSLKEGKILFSLARNSIIEGVIVEIGSYRGGSTILLAKGSKVAQKGKVYAVDPFNRDSESTNILIASILPHFLKNIKNAEVDDWIIPIVKTSIEAARNWKKPISLLFIDGDHGYGYVKADFLLWEKHLLKGGVIAFHDVNPPFEEGPNRVVEENILHSRRFGNIKKVYTMIVAQKLESSSFSESLQNTFRLFWLKILTPQLVSRLFLIYLEIDRRIGKIGIFLKCNYPKLYFLIKKIKD